MPARADETVQRGAEARRDRKLDLAVRALCQLVHVLQRETVRRRPKVDPLEQPTTVEPLPVVGRLAYRHDPVGGGGLRLAIPRGC